MNINTFDLRRLGTFPRLNRDATRCEKLFWGYLGTFLNSKENGFCSQPEMYARTFLLRLLYEYEVDAFMTCMFNFHYLSIAYQDILSFEEMKLWDLVEEIFADIHMIYIRDLDVIYLYAEDYERIFKEHKDSYKRSYNIIKRRKKIKKLKKMAEKR